MALDTNTLPAFPIDIRKAAVQPPINSLGRSFGIGLPTAAQTGGFGSGNAPGSREAQLNMESIQGLKMEQGTPNPSGFLPSLPTVYGESKKPDNLGFYGVNRAPQGLPTMEAAVAQSPEITTAPVAAAVAPIMAPPKELSNFEKAKAYSTASPDQRPEVVGTRFQRAYTGLNQETAAQAQATKASGAGSAGGILDLDETTTYNQQMQPETKTKHYGTLDASGALQRLNLPTIAAKEPSQADLEHTAKLRGMTVAQVRTQLGLK